ncbi:MAG TPA: hypothetical protein IGP91_03100 [Thermosynechococcus sp. M46_R2017_013]|nr:hypothetical protein [Thermosynechococcus sp. M46_R2017_013]
MTCSARRLAAARGDLEAIQALLGAALAPQGIAVTVHQRRECLLLRLQCPTAVAAAIVLTLLARELISWPSYAHSNILITAYQDSKERWQEVLDLTHPHELQRLAKGGHLRQNLALPRKEEFGIPVQPLSPRDWQVIAAGFGLSLLLLASEQVTFLLSPLITLVHEMGHAVMAWLFGYAAVPAFDFRYGGGVTLHGDRAGGIVLLIYTGLLALAYFYRHHRLTLACLGVLTLLYTLVAFTPVHEMLFVAMGHGFELIFAVIFLYRALSGWGCRYPIERPLYSMVGFFIVFFNMRFAWQLQFNPVFREMYLMGKGGMDHDFVRLARDFFHTDLATVVGFYGFFVVLTPAIAFLLYRYRQLMVYLFVRLFIFEGESHRRRRQTGRR